MFKGGGQQNECNCRIWGQSYAVIVCQPVNEYEIVVPKSYEENMPINILDAIFLSAQKSDHSHPLFLEEVSKGIHHLEQCSNVQQEFQNVSWHQEKQ